MHEIVIAISMSFRTIEWKFVWNIYYLLKHLLLCLNLSTKTKDLVKENLNLIFQYHFGREIKHCEWTSGISPPTNHRCWCFPLIICLVCLTTSKKNFHVLMENEKPSDSIRNENRRFFSSLESLSKRKKLLLSIVNKSIKFGLELKPNMELWNFQNY